MKKVIIALLFFVITASLSHTNIVSMGPRVGASISQVKANLVQGKTELASLRLEDHWGYHVGLFARFDLFAFYVQPEVLLTGSGAKFKKNNKTLKLGFTKLDIPAMLGLSFLGVVRAQLGPVFSFLLSATEGDKDIREHYSSITAGWQAGLGVDIWKMGIDLKYEGSLSRFGNEIAGISTNHGHAQWILSVGVNVL